MISNEDHTTVQAHGKYSRSVILTRQLKELGLKKDDRVYVAVEHISDDEKIIIIKKAE